MYRISVFGHAMDNDHTLLQIQLQGRYFVRNGVTRGLQCRIALENRNMLSFLSLSFTAMKRLNSAVDNS